MFHCTWKIGSTTGRCTQRSIEDATRHVTGTRGRVRRYPIGINKKQNSTQLFKGRGDQHVVIFGDSQLRPFVKGDVMVRATSGSSVMVNCTPGAQFAHISKINIKTPVMTDYSQDEVEIYGISELWVFNVSFLRVNCLVLCEKASNFLKKKRNA
ncbi:uncharacterized protein [Apostichopus japonicus]|uniref:uncharacterized protein n=1 Tax=Stichopus japonicus TaxID=307972 RepID=UPI003AB530D5